MKALVTGAGALLGQGIIRALKMSTLNAEIVAVDPSPAAAGLYLADRASLIPPVAAPNYLDALRNVLRADRPDIVFVGTDVELPLIAAHRHELEAEFATKVLVSSPEPVAVANDKWLTFKFLERLGAPRPASCLPGGEQELVESVGFPLVIKPRVGARSVGLSLVRNARELANAVRAEGILIQEYVGDDSCEFTAGTVSFPGQPTISIVMRRELRDGNTYRAYSGAFPELNEQVRSLADALSPFGPLNLQFRVVNGQAYVFEMNARFSGTTPLRAYAGFNETELCARHLLHGAEMMQPAVRDLVFLRYLTEVVIPPEALAATGPGPLSCG